MAKEPTSIDPVTDQLWNFTAQYQRILGPTWSNHVHRGAQGIDTAPLQIQAHAATSWLQRRIRELERMLDGRGTTADGPRMIVEQDQRFVFLERDLATRGFRGIAGWTSASHARLRRAMVVATLYLWDIVPVKLRLLRGDFHVDGHGRGSVVFGPWPRESAATFEAELMFQEGSFLRKLRTSAAHDGGHRPHAFCENGYWYAAALADCRDWLDSALYRGEDALPALDCTVEGHPSLVAAAILWEGRCLADLTLWHLICGYMPVVLGRGAAEALPHFGTAALALLLCDGCRVDGYGFHAVALDEVLLTFGFLVLSGREGGLPPAPVLGPQLADVLAVHRWRPGGTTVWRGLGDARVLFGRHVGCPAVLRPRVCISGTMLASWDPVAPASLHTCSYEKNRKDFHTIKVFQPNQASVVDLPAWSACEEASDNVVLLALPVYIPLLRHLTSAMILLLSSLSWFHGSSGPAILAALWRREGLRVTNDGGSSDAFRLPKLVANSTELVFVTTTGTAETAEAIDRDLIIPWSFLLRLLSSRPPLSLRPGAPCRCFAAGAVWGHPDPPFSTLGDLGRYDARSIRTLLSRASAGWGQLGSRGLPFQRSRAAAPKEMSSAEAKVAVHVLLVDRGPVGLLRPVVESKRRNLTNAASLAVALRQADCGGALLNVARVVMQHLSLAVQVRAALRAEILVGVFGASLAWAMLLKAGAFVIELHPPDGSPHFGSCFAADRSGSSWDVNPRSEWGAWALAIGVHHACVALPRLDQRRCGRDLEPRQWEVAAFAVDLTASTTLTCNAAQRLTKREQQAT